MEEQGLDALVGIDIIVSEDLEIEAQNKVELSNIRKIVRKIPKIYIGQAKYRRGFCSQQGYIQTSVWNKIELGKK